ncbi:SDR family NAD(P)-dependent oxidoreductase [Sneathiella chinensis]|uniref:Short-chain dehydrogenase n=1 Tax=Sneathiella chinensis TaxID=349750 RepID=A0ABQ5U1Y0_9PROT|nr:SDR family oxidoreductase [Sneathiella chinensis]GLQ06182.1 short-chain dehydrogenase [Sneathiella chinensis]
MTSLKDKVVIITGASRGIGAAVAHEMAAQGARLALSARNAASCSDILETIGNNGGEAFAVGCDVSSFEAVEKLVADTLERYGRIDAIVNNAGIIDPIALIEDTDPEDWARNISVNLVGVYNGIRAVLPHFYKQSSGIIINVSSGAAHNPLEGWSAYCSGKAGVYMLTRATALEAAEKGVRVYGFGPGTVDTDMQGLIRSSGINRVSQMPRENLFPANEPAAAITWLCSDDAADLAGQELSVRDEELRQRVGLPAL